MYSSQCALCTYMILFFFFKQKTAYEMRISDWSSDVYSSDLRMVEALARPHVADDAFAGVDADADVQRQEWGAGVLRLLLALAVQHHQVPEHLEGGLAGPHFLEIGRAHV